MLLNQLVEAWQAARRTRSRLAKAQILAGVLALAGQDEAEIVASYLAGSLRQRRTGVGYRSLQRQPPAAASPSLTVTEVDAAFERMSRAGGRGSAGVRSAELDRLLAAATVDEQHYLISLIGGELRQGALEALVQEAIAKAAGRDVEQVRRAAMLAGSTPAVAASLLAGGSPASFGLVAGSPLKPMLAASAPTLADAFAKAAPDGGPVAVDTKLDGVRVQVHKVGTEVRVWSRSLDDITARMPEVAEAVAGLPHDLVLDGEALSLDAEGRPRPFQESASIAASRGASGLSVLFFDLLHLDGTDLIDRPLGARLADLDDVLPPVLRVRRIVGPTLAEAIEFNRAVLDAGHEGVLVKQLAAPYAAGRRGAGWVKVKPVLTLDLVVLAVEWGSGRRQGTLSNLHLGARDPAGRYGPPGGFVMLGKTFKGMTDAMLAWQTQRFEEMATDRGSWVVRVRPEQVVEIAFDGVQRSSTYPGGVALRFARVVRYRDDKTAAEADTIDAVRLLLRG